MTIMFAGGMTIAIPGETPVALAQTGMLSVSATAAPDNSFGGPQVIEIEVDDPSRNELESPMPHVTVDGDAVTMVQAGTGKWYAYVASDDLRSLNDIEGVTVPPTGEISAIAGLLSNAPNVRATPTEKIDDIRTFGFDGDVDIVFGSETITLNYDRDLDDLATVNTDRTGVPEGAEVHVTISDFRLNLDPTENDVWFMVIDGDHAEYEIGDALDTDDVGTAAAISDWQQVFKDSNAGEFAISNVETVAPNGTVTDKDIVQVSDLEPDETATEPVTATVVRFEETGANTGVFTSEDSNDKSNIKAVGSENDDFTIEYADGSVQVFIESFDSTLEAISDGTWNSGNSLTVRLTDENLDTNTLTDQDMGIGDDVPVLMIGTPITLKDLNSTTMYDNDNNPDTADVPSGTITINYDNTRVGNLTISDTDVPLVFTISLTEPEVDQISNGMSYVHYIGPSVTVAGLGLIDPLTGSVAEPSLTGVSIEDGADITLTYVTTVTGTHTVIFDIFTFGENADGDTVNHAIYRALLDETDAGAVFEATIEYEMLNQRTVDKADTHDNVVAIGNELVMILDTGYTGTDAPEIDYAGDNASEDAPTNTGEVALDSETYRVADDVTITLTDADLNTDSGSKEIYPITDADMKDLVTIEIAGKKCLDDKATDDITEGISEVSLRETADDSGVFEGSFEVPSNCGTGENSGTTGESISVTYTDFRDDTGGDSEWSDSATIRADTGSVSLDRSVYPIPTAEDAEDEIEATKVTVTISVDDSDENTSSSSREKIKGVTVKLDSKEILADTKELEETDSDSGIFETTVKLNSTANMADVDDNNIEQGDIITATYEDQSDASGNVNTVSDSATFDLRNAVLQSDKSTYVIGQDALITLIEPDLNLDSGTVDSVDLARIAWESDAADTHLKNDDFGAVPQSLRETGDNTGIFQVVITIPVDLSDDEGSSDKEFLARGESITLTYNDRSPSGANTVGDDDRNVELNIKTSDFGATVELDQNVYTWTDKVFITIVASDYNFDSNIVDEIGPEDKGEITVRTRGDDLKEYRLAETGPDTGVFTGEIVLTGQENGIDPGSPTGNTGGSGPTNGELEAKSSDGLSVSFDFSDGQAPIVASALIRWNIGEVQWLEASYAATGSGIVRVIDPDMNLNPDAVDNLDVVVYSETFLGGIDLTVTETQESSGIFEGTVEFDPETASQGHRLQVTEGDIITASYEDVTVPDDDDLEITATTLIGSIVPPLERAPASNPAIVDAFGNSLASVSADQQVQITADLTSGQDRDQDFAYLVQIQNEDGVTIALSWITGTLGAGATFSPSQSWTPSETGSYTATIFVWESVSNPTALSPQLSITIDVV